MKREFLQELTAGGAPLSKEVIDAIMAENGRDIQAAKQSSCEWEEKYNAAVQAHRQELESLRFAGLLTGAVRAAGGRNEKVIAALLDLESLKNAEDPQAALQEALDAVRQENGYLFMEQALPPLYASGTGVRPSTVQEQPATLAGALRERFEKGR